VDEAAPDAEAMRRRFEHAREVLNSYAAFMSAPGRLNSFVDRRRHRRDDPARGAAAVAADTVLTAGVPDPVAAPPLVAEELA
jgi:hypothetical protein